MPLQKYSDESEETICSACKFLPTKPESIPDEIADAVMTAYELDCIKRSGGYFAYPNSLNAYEWTCLKGLQSGREKAEALKQERDEKKRRLEEKKKQLNS